MILEYMLIRNAEGTQTPSWVEDGGYFRDPETNTYIGWSPALPDRDYYIPETVVTLSRADLVSRALSLHRENPRHRLSIEDRTTVPLTDAEIESEVNDWCDAYGEL